VRDGLQLRLSLDQAEYPPAGAALPDDLTAGGPVPGTAASGLRRSVWIRPGSGRSAYRVPPQRDRAAVRDEPALRRSFDRAESATAGESLRNDSTAGGAVPDTAAGRSGFGRAAAEVRIAFRRGETVPQCETSRGFDGLSIGRNPQRPVGASATTRRLAGRFLRPPSDVAPCWPATIRDPPRDVNGQLLGKEERSPRRSAG
jgi:hypothetical protein